jgi:RNA polymerase sigma-70 factor (ECF subfamily)
MTATASRSTPPATPRDLEAHRAALTGHCYRMLGSAAEADDAVQEAMVRAWRALDRFEGRASLRTWLTRIATRVCLDDVLTLVPNDQWIEPIPDVCALPTDVDPAELASLRQSIRLAFIAVLQHLPPRQRAALLLTEILGWPAAEVAESLDTSVAAVNSAVQRARATLAARDLTQASTPLSAPQSAALARYVDAFERYDVDALTALLHDDATLSMPPYSLWLRGPQTIHTWLLGRGAGCRGSRLLPTAACGSPAFGQYRAKPDGGHTAWALVVLEFSGDRIAAWTAFLDVGAVFPRFGLPLELP